MSPSPSLPLPRSLRALLFGAVVAVVLPASAYASTAANTKISNVAKVNYKDAGNNDQPEVVSAPADVTVQLVASAPNLSSPANQTIQQGTSATLSYTITGTANGLDTYTLGSGATPSNVTGVTPAFPASVQLGGTTLSADATVGATTIQVPFDGNSDGSVNGIAVSDKIVIGGVTYTVAAISENPGTNRATITLSSAITVLASVGQIVGETQTFTVTVASGNVTGTNTSGTQTVVSTATSTTTATATTTQTTPTVITVNRSVLTISKLVSIDGGATFAATANAAPGTSLVYKIVVSNAGASAASAVVITDVIPEYLSYVAGSARTAPTAGTAYTSATAITDPVDSDSYSFDSVARKATLAPSGTLAANSDIVLFFTAKID
ncbi:DUF11 domain-containing protein [Aggregicoccus sp. 17bor-14]|uniref:DUF11 domain-containing protein n=1 Tax=Myxococcaceae TaxID=31 RepID=UPI00129C98D9|nr:MULTISPECIES: DUF11 domain-containing protein [Myxococcaceae]MBF5041543.1 DUF11 domain-containing protein [Simulacricoccus sp. 17bor-14]MRI87328.1 DUF11 domain-containing protein [Aggregicoccus sp. 17bor-14]